MHFAAAGIDGTLRVLRYVSNEVRLRIKMVLTKRLADGDRCRFFDAPRYLKVIQFIETKYIKTYMNGNCFGQALRLLQ